MTMGVANDPDADCPALPMAAEASITTTRGLRRSERRANAASLALFLWLSPAFPVGAYAYSHGIEWAVEAGDVSDGARCRLARRPRRPRRAAADASLFAAAYRAARPTPRRARETNELAVALAGSAERRLETTAQGDAFLIAARAAWPCAALESLPRPRSPIPSPSARRRPATASRWRSRAPLSRSPCSRNLVSAGLRLGPVGQTEGQRISRG